MNPTPLLPWLLAAGLVGGCGALDVPLADNYPASSQKKPRAVHHWDVLADDVAARVQQKIQAYPEALPAVFVVPSVDTPFNRGFHQLLLTRLVERGVPVTRQPGPLVVRFDTQVVQHGSEVANRNPLTATSLVAGVAVVRDLYTYAHTTASYAANLLTAGALVDASRLALDGPAQGGPTRTEVLVGTSLEKGDVYVGRTADVYYIDPADTRLYQPPSPRPPPSPLKDWKVVAQ